MIVVDSSAWVEYYRPVGFQVVKAAVARAIEADLVTVNGIIQVEILAFAPGSSNLAKLISDFKIYNWIELDEDDFDFATEMGFFLRRRSITIKAADLIIAASAIRTRSLLYHTDSHFDDVARHFELKSRNLLASQLN